MHNRVSADHKSGGKKSRTADGTYMSAADGNALMLYMFTVLLQHIVCVHFSILVYTCIIGF